MKFSNNGFKERKNKLKSSDIRKCKKVELKVNDMHIIGFKSNKTHNWNVQILHEEKDTGSTKVFTNGTDFVEYLNAYIETARTPIMLLREFK